MRRIKTTIGNVADIVNGATPSTSRADFYGGEIHWLTPNDVSDQKTKYTVRGERNITIQGLASCSAKLVPKGTVLLTSRAPIGLLSIAKSELCTNQGFKSLIPNIGAIDSEYLFYYLKLQVKNLNRLGAKTTFKEITKDDVAGFPIVIPEEINDQQGIASILTALDAKIELNNRINAELEAMAKTLYDFWFVQFDFPDKNGKPYKSSCGKMAWNEKLKRDIPEGWDDGTLDDLGQIVGGSTPSTKEAGNFTMNGTPWITPNDLSDNQGKKFISHGALDVSDEGIKDASLKKYPSGTVLLSSRAPIGYMAIAQIELTTNQGFKSFIPSNGYSTEFIYYTVRNSLPAIIQYASGSTFKEVSASILKTVKIILPSKAVVDHFSEFTKPIFKRQEMLEEENHELARLRDWLLPMLMNGQVQVR